MLRALAGTYPVKLTPSPATGASLHDEHAQRSMIFLVGLQAPERISAEIVVVAGRSVRFALPAYQSPPHYDQSVQQSAPIRRLIAYGTALGSQTSFTSQADGTWIVEHANGKDTYWPDPSTEGVKGTRGLVITDRKRMPMKFFISAEGGQVFGRAFGQSDWEQYKSMETTGRARD